jgi:hypothetical protein
MLVFLRSGCIAARRDSSVWTGNEAELASIHHYQEFSGLSEKLLPQFGKEESVPY